MKLLISNDDGIYSPGIVVLAEAASRFGNVRIVAPDVEQSSIGSGITASRPVDYRRTPIQGFEAYRVNGTPSDCVSLGTHLWEKVDIVLSGINLGSNLGNALWPSGTLAAARQAALLGFRGMALSLAVTHDEPHFETIRPWVEKVLDLLLPETTLPLVNINFPENPIGIAWTRQSSRRYNGAVAPAKDPMGREHYWFTVSPINEVDEGTDRWAIQRNLVSITPLRLDLTDDQLLERMRLNLNT